MAEIDVSQFDNHWYKLLEADGVDLKHLDGNHHPCPICGGRDRFRFDDLNGRGTYYCNGCGAGDGMSLLMKRRGQGFKEAAQFALDELHMLPVVPSGHHVPKRETQIVDANRVHDSLVRTARGCSRVMTGDTVWQYLIGTRWLNLTEIPKAIKIHPSLAYYEKGDGGKSVKVGEFPAMVAVVRSPDGRAISLHRTYLTKDAKKANVASPKKLMTGIEKIDGGAIRLYPAGKQLAVAEGLETAFAVALMTGIPTWALISSTIMKAFVIPEEVEELLIFGDNDLPDEKGRRAGQEAAAFLQEKALYLGKKCSVTLPRTPGTDFADLWKEKRAARERVAA